MRFLFLEEAILLLFMVRVSRQSSFVYNPQFELEDYLSLAAGITQLADEDNIYIVGRLMVILPNLKVVGLDLDQKSF